MYLYRRSYLLIDKQLPTEGLTGPSTCYWIYREKNVSGQVHKMVWRNLRSEGSLFSMFISNCTHRKLFWLVSTILASLSRKLCVCLFVSVCLSVYSSPGFNFKLNSRCDSLFPILFQTSTCSLLRTENGRIVQNEFELWWWYFWFSALSSFFKRII